MKQRVIVKVERMVLGAAVAIRTKAYEQIVELPDGLSIPYESLCSSFRFIYGQDCIISFELSKF